MVVQEALRQRAAQQRARWEAFQKKKRRDEEEEEAARGRRTGAGGGAGGSRPWQHPDSEGSDGGAINAPASSFHNEVFAAAAQAQRTANNNNNNNSNNNNRDDDGGGSGEAAVDPTSAHSHDADDGSGAPLCRICFAGEEAGRLFSPCRCRGSIGKVHVRQGTLINVCFSHAHTHNRAHARTRDTPPRSSITPNDD